MNLLEFSEIIDDGIDVKILKKEFRYRCDKLKREAKGFNDCDGDCSGECECWTYGSFREEVFDGRTEEIPIKLSKYSIEKIFIGAQPLGHTAKGKITTFDKPQMIIWIEEANK